MHRIRRQRWQVQAPDRDAAFALRAGVRQHLDALNDAFARGFDAIEQDNCITRIPRLTLHLRIASTDELIEKLPMALAEQLACALLAPPQAEDAVRHLALPTFRHDTLLHYLASGKLDWAELHQDAPAIRSALTATARQLFLEQTWSSLLAALPQTLPRATLFFQRLLPLLAAHELPRLMERAAQARSPSAGDSTARRVLVDALSALVAAPALPALPADQRHRVAAMQLSCLSLPAPPAAEQLLEALQPGLGAPHIRAWLRHLREQGQAFVVPANHAWPDTLPPHADTEAAAAAPARAAATVPVPSAPPLEPAESAPPLPALLAALQLRDLDDAPAQGLGVHLAGLVLLHPYLPRLFEACAIHQEKQGIAPGHLARAAALLHWLACSRDEVHEFELGAIKPLLGISPEAPLPLCAGLLSDADKDECNALLDAAIGYWQALGATSRDGLRVSFLQRAGLLIDTGGHWQLMLESEAFDILLAQLPWSISLIKLPWMTKPIFTDWPTH